MIGSASPWQDEHTSSTHCQSPRQWPPHPLSYVPHPHLLLPLPLRYGYHHLLLRQSGAISIHKARKLVRVTPSICPPLPLPPSYPPFTLVGRVQRCRCKRAPGLTMKEGGEEEATKWCREHRGKGWRGRCDGWVQRAGYTHTYT